MSSLAPDVGLIGENRTVWIDAKYKAHLAEIARRGWRETAEHIREAHRADLHQALAYAALADTERVDTVLLYPHLGPSEAPLPVAVASLTSGKRQVRLVLGALPFGFSTPAERDASIRQWRELLAA